MRKWLSKFCQEVLKAIQGPKAMTTIFVHTRYYIERKSFCFEVVIKPLDSDGFQLPSINLSFELLESSIRHPVGGCYLLGDLDQVKCERKL